MGGITPEIAAHKEEARDARERRTQVGGSGPDPRAMIRSDVNDVSAMLRSLVGGIERNPDAIEIEDVEKIEAFLHGQVETAMRFVRDLVSKHPGLVTRFDFDMPLPAPASLPERHPATGAVTPRLASRRPPAANSDDAVPIGRLVGTREKVFGETDAPPPRTAPKPTVDGDVDDDGDGSGTGFLGE